MNSEKNILNFNYSPIFKLKNENQSNSNNQNSQVINYAPSFDQISVALMKLDSLNSSQKFLEKLYASGKRININYSVLVSEHHALGIEIHIPVLTPNSLCGMFIYKSNSTNWSIKYKSFESLNSELNDNEKSKVNLKCLSSFNLICFSKFNVIYLPFNDKVFEVARELNSNEILTSRSCYEYVLYLNGYVISLQGGLLTGDHFSIKELTIPISSWIDCDPELEAPCCGDGTIPSGGTGFPGIGSDIFNLVPSAYHECLEKFASGEALQEIEKILESGNSCLKNEILNKLADICAKASSNSINPDLNVNWVDLVDSNGVPLGDAFGNGTGQFGPEDLELDHIVFPENFDKNCPCFDKMIKIIDGSGSGNFLCKMVNTMFGSSNFVQTFEISEHAPKVFNQVIGNVGTILIPKKYCDGTSKLSDLELTSQFIHELMHGYLYTLLKDKYPNSTIGQFLIDDPNSDNPEDLIWDHTYWLDLVKEYNDVTEVNGNHHVIFFTHFKNLINEALHDINGGVGSPADYEYYSNIIVNTSNLGISPWNDELGLGYLNSDGIRISTFNNDDTNLKAWNENVGGDNAFKFNCN